MRNTAFLLMMSLSLTGCGKDRVIDHPGPQYLSQTIPENVIKNFVVSYNLRDIDGYAVLLADDYQFYFDEGGRQTHHDLPVSWRRSDEVVTTGKLFDCPTITGIHLDLTFGNARPVNDIGREGWVYIDVLDVLLEAELTPDPPGAEGVTLRIDGGHHRFYLRRGRTPADTASEKWYLVEWKDYGTWEKLAGVTGQAVEATTWAELKAFCQ